MIEDIAVLSTKSGRKRLGELGVGVQVGKLLQVKEFRIFSWPRRRVETCPPPSHVKIIAWNCKGLTKPNTVSHLKMLVAKHRPHCIFIMKPKCSEERICKIGRLLKFTNAKAIGAKGKVGGIGFMWNNEVHLQVEWKSNHIFCAKMSNILGEEQWRL